MLFKKCKKTFKMLLKMLKWDPIYKKEFIYEVIVIGHFLKWGYTFLNTFWSICILRHSWICPFDLRSNLNPWNFLKCLQFKWACFFCRELKQFREESIPKGNGGQRPGAAGRVNFRGLIKLFGKKFFTFEKLIWQD